MNLPLLTVLLAVVSAHAFLLPKGHDAYFIENNLVYSRLMVLMHDGTYRQINKESASAAEVDGGAWTQTADGTVCLHSTHHALRFRALLSGPLLVVLDGEDKLNALPRLAAAIRRCLDATADAVFDAHTVAECSTPDVSVSIDPRAETFSRADLQALAIQIDDASSSHRTGIYLLTPWKISGAPTLLILQDAVFQSSDLARVNREYHVKPGDAPPFYFAQVDARTFARTAGTFKAFRYLGGTD